MKRIRTSWMAMGILGAMLAGTVETAWAGQAEVDAQIKILTGEDAEARQKARRALADMGAEAVAALLKAADHKDRSIAKAAKMALFDIVAPTGRLGGEYERQAVCKVLAAELNNAALSKRVRDYVCRLISYVGREDVVPALVTALSAQDVREMARWALSRNPTDAALNALHDALDKGDAAFRVGVINAIGHRGKRRSVPLLVKELGHSDEDVRLAAMRAIAKIPDPFAMDALRDMLTAGSDKQKAAARADWLLLAETLLESGRPVAADMMYNEALAWGVSSVQDRCAALYGIGKAGQEGALETLLSAVQTADHDDLRGTIVEALVEMTSPQVTTAVVDLLTAKKKGLFSRRPRLSDENKAALVRVLTRRKDKAGQPGAIAALESDAEQVRIAALECLAVIGNEEAAPSLAASLQSESEAERKAAVRALGNLPAPQGLQWLQKEVCKDGLSRDYRILLVQAIGDRREPGSVDALSALLDKGPDEAVRIAIFEALGTLGTADALPTLLKGVDKQEGKDRDAAESAMLKLDAEATDRMIKAVEGATPAQKVALLKVLGFRHDKRIKDVLLSGYQSQNTDVKAAAIEGLRRLADPSTLSVLEEAGETGPARGPAVSGMINIGVKLQKEQNKKDEALTIYHKALKLATRDKEIRPALDRLAEIADPSSFDAIQPFLKKGNAKRNAAEAMLAIAPKLQDGMKDKAIPPLRQAVAIAPTSKRAGAALKKLRDWGVDIDTAKEAGFITHWWVVGPFPSPDKKMFEGKAFPEDKVDLDAKGKHKGKEYAWKKVHISDPSGEMNLRKKVAEADNVAAYAYAEVTSPKDRDVLFKIGSDDDVVCWLNGEKIHANKVSRGLQVDQDVVKAKLKKGVNRILMKVLNGGSHWQMCLRITDPQGKPLQLKQRQK